CCTGRRRIETNEVRVVRGVNVPAHNTHRYVCEGEGLCPCNSDELRFIWRATGEFEPSVRFLYNCEPMLCSRPCKVLTRIPWIIRSSEYSKRVVMLSMSEWQI